MSRTILLTGATGTLGSQLLKQFRSRGDQLVCLVRAPDQARAEARLAWAAGHQRLRVLRADIREPSCGLSAEAIAALRGKVDLVLHCAASINFLDQQEASATNIAGLRNVLALADALGVNDFRHVSTAYVAGDARAFAEGDLDVGQSWRNAYERSKFEGEQLVRAWAGAGDGRAFTVFRPAIIVGCADGSIPAFDAYYTYFKPFAVAAASMRRRSADRLPDNIAVSKGGAVTLPVAIQAGRDAPLNLVPLDWVADCILRLLGRRAANETFQLVHPAPLQTRDVITMSLRLLSIAGVRVVETAAEKEALLAGMPPVLGRLHRGIDRVLTTYLPYTSTRLEFGNAALVAALGAAAVPPPIDETYLARLLAYAERMRWGGVAAPVDAPSPVKVALSA